LLDFSYKSHALIAEVPDYNNHIFSFFLLDLLR